MAPTTPTSPPLVALVRAILIGAAIAALVAVSAGLEAIGGPDLAGIVPEAWQPVALAILALIIRTIEGWVDKLRGQAPQAGLLGGAPNRPADYIEVNGRAVDAASTRALRPER